MPDLNSQDYQVVEEAVTDGDIPVTIYQNRVTGLRIVTAYTEMPLVKGEFALATEAFDDDGLPHTLEHLVFLGSEDYPYKGVLDLLANRCLADGTNAMTDTDYTSYSICTAGADGFMSILPVYLDHILFPTLTDQAYLTEVHHINAEGENAGVVYCEMQARENSGDSVCHREMTRAMYPGKCGYRSETGGMLEPLRTSTSNEKVRQYHKDFYHTKNLCIIVTGPCKANDIFKAIKPIEDKVVQKQMHKINFERPWQTPIEPLEASVQKKIKYSSETDDDGLVYVGFRGPSAVENFRELTAISVLLDYLNDTAISPIQRDFVESDEPYCSSVSHSIVENSISYFYLEFESVGKQYWDKVSDKLFQLLRDICNGVQSFDLDRLKKILSRRKVQILSIAETSPHSMVMGSVVGHFLYGKGNVQDRFQEIPTLDDLSKKETDFWLNLIAKYMTGPDARHVCIVGEPCPVTMKEMNDKEKERLDTQKENLKEKLPEFGSKLKEALEINGRPTPAGVIDKVAVPSIDNIMYHQIERSIVDQGKTQFRIQYDSIKTNFVSIALLMNSSQCLAQKDRLYLPLLSEMIFESPIQREGELIPYESVVAELFSDTISYDCSIGLSGRGPYSVGQLGMLFTIAMQVEVDKYERGVKWFHEILYKTVFTPERIKTVVTRLLSDISQYKRSGDKISSATMNGINYQSNCNQWACNFLRQQKFLKQLLKDLKSEPETIEKQLTRVRDQLAQPANILVHLSLNKNKVNVEKIHEPWSEFLPQSYRGQSAHINFEDIIMCNKSVQTKDAPKEVIVSLGSCESNYMLRAIRSIDTPHHPDLAALNVLIKYLCQLEGPMWRQIRGQGLSYNYSISQSPYDGLMFFVLWRAAQVVEAYRTGNQIVAEFLDGKLDFDNQLFQAAKSIKVFELIAKEKSATSKSMQSLVSHIMSLPIDFNRHLIKQTMLVTKDDLVRVGQQYLRPLFNECDQRTAVCCNPSKLDDVVKGLADADCRVEVLDIEQAKFLTALE